MNRSIEQEACMPTLRKALSKNPPRFIPLHEQLTERCPVLSATRPSDIDFASGCAAMALSVEEPHRQDVLAAFQLGIEAQIKHESDGARRIVQGLHRARQMLERLQYDARAAQGEEELDLSRASSFAGNGAEREERQAAN
jgi:hypothetical protein